MEPVQPPEQPPDEPDEKPDKAFHPAPSGHLALVLGQTLAGLTCQVCHSKYNGAAGQPVCPLCESKHAEQHLLKLQDRRFQIQQELADLTGQISSIIASIQRAAHVSPGPAETITCMDCGGWLHLGWVQVPNTEHHVVCESCGIKRGVREGYQRSEWCHHGYPIKMCRPCRAVHRGLVRDAEQRVAKQDNLTRAVSERKRAPKVSLDDMEEI